MALADASGALEELRGGMVAAKERAREGEVGLSSAGSAE